MKLECTKTGPLHRGGMIVCGPCDHFSARRSFLNDIPMAHPNFLISWPITPTFFPLHRRVSIFAVISGLHLSTQLLRQKLHSVTDPENRSDLNQLFHRPPR